MTTLRIMLNRVLRPGVIYTTALSVGFVLCWILVINQAAPRVDRLVKACQPSDDFSPECITYAQNAANAVGSLTILAILALAATAASYLVTRYSRDSSRDDEIQYRIFAGVAGVSLLLSIVAANLVDVQHVWMPDAAYLQQQVIDGQRLFGNDISLQPGGLPLNCPGSDCPPG
jgi:hypothetical protein